MDLTGYVVNAVLVGNRSVKEVCEAHDISRSWLYELIARYRELGEDGLKPQSKRPRSSPTRVAPVIEDEIVTLRKDLTELGVDAGASTIHYHLQRRHRRRRSSVPSVATIWRVLTRRGFIVPQPQKWPKLVAALLRRATQRVPAGRHHPLGPRRRHRGRDPQRHRRPLPPPRHLPGLCHRQGRRCGRDLPSGRHRTAGAGLHADRQRCHLHRREPRWDLRHRARAAPLGVDYKHSRPYHPQTCGKVERFHQTLKRWLAKQRRATTVAGL
jgi:transposase